MRPTIVRSHPAVVAAPPAAKARRAPMSDAWVQRLNTLQVLVVAVLILAPIAWMVMSSFKPPAEVTA
jgi:ABC-type glycerol-3-phosphate transport system permease component